ncbi:MAG TPA: hypothetical protein VIY29_25055 [Ktedonobacteraceae bacterium]
MKVSNAAIPDAKQSQPGKTPLRLLDIVSRGWSWLFLLVLLIFFSITGQGFLNIYNFQTIGADMSLVLIMALGQTFVIISGGIDLSTGFVMGMASVAAALVMSGLGSSVPLFVVVLAGAAAGLGIGLIPGLINGVIIARLRVQDVLLGHQADPVPQLRIVGVQVAVVVEDRALGCGPHPGQRTQQRRLPRAAGADDRH